MINGIPVALCIYLFFYFCFKSLVQNPKHQFAMKKKTKTKKKNKTHTHTHKDQAKTQKLQKTKCKEFDPMYV